MKQLLALALLLPCFASADPGTASTRTFQYEVTLPNDPVKRLVSVKEGSTEEVSLLGKVTIYPKSATTVPKSSWKAWARAGHTPAHDQVICGKDVCTYTVNGQVREEERLTLSLEDNAGSVITRMAYLESTTTSELAGFSNIGLGPVQNIRQWMDKRSFAVGESFTVPKIPGVTVTLVSID